MEDKIKIKHKGNPFLRVLLTLFVIVFVLPFAFIIFLFSGPSSIIHNYNIEETNNILSDLLQINDKWVEKILLSQRDTSAFLWDSITQIVLKLKESETKRLIGNINKWLKKFEHWNNPPTGCDYEDYNIKKERIKKNTQTLSGGAMYINESDLKEKLIKDNLYDKTKSFYYYTEPNFVEIQWKQEKEGDKTIIIDETDNLLYYCNFIN